MLNSQVLRGYSVKWRRDLKRLKRVVRNPQYEFAGKRHLASLRRLSSSKLRLDRRAGAMRFDIRSIPSAKQTFELLSTLGEKWVAEEDPERHARDFPINMLLSSDLRKYPEILEFALLDEFLLPVSEYLGQVPRLVKFGLLRSPPTYSAYGKEVKGSQLYHYDPHDNWGVKVFVNLNRVDEESGPLYFLPANVSDRFNAKIGYTRERVPDDVVYSVCSRDEVLDSRGEAGTGVMVDTGRCLHYGSRKTNRDRLVLMMNFTRPNCTNPGSCSTLDPVRGELAQLLYARDPVRHYVLTAGPPPDPPKVPRHP